METKNNITPAQATHPGELLKDEIDATPGLNQRKLAKEIDVQPSLLNEIIKGKRPITADIAILLEKVLGISADYWMRFQSQYEIDAARIKGTGHMKARILHYLHPLLKRKRRSYASHYKTTGTNEPIGFQIYFQTIK